MSQLKINAKRKVFGIFQKIYHTACEIRLLRNCFSTSHTVWGITHVCGTFVDTHNPECEPQ